MVGSESGLDVRKLLKGFADGAEFARGADLVLETAEDARDIADTAEVVLDVGGDGGGFDEFLDGGLSALNFVKIEERFGEILL